MSVQGLAQNHTLELLRELLFVPPVSVVATFSIIMIVTYALIMTERLHKTLAALGGAVATILAGKYFSAVYSWVPVADCVISWMQGVPACGKPLLFTDQQVFTEMIDWPTIIIIISLIIIAAVASRSGIFEYLCIKVVKLSGGDLRRLFTYLCLLSFALTAIIGNDPAFIIISALTLTLTRALGVDPRPYILGEVFVINAASTSTLVGSFVNIPILKRDVVVREVPQSPVFRLFGIFEYPRLVVKKQVVCINLGGAVIPLLVAVYLLSRVPLYPVALAFVLVCVVCYVLATPVQGVGIVLPAFVPPIVSALAAIVLYPQSPAGVAFCAGVLGTIVGADLLHLPSLLKGGADVLSIGGAGVFDGIFLTGVLAVLLS